MAEAAAIANATYASTRATAGSTTEAAVSGASAGAVEILGGSNATATAAGQSVASIMRSFATVVGKDKITTSFTTAAKKIES
jgi:selenophosphate synthetase-related protein